MRKRRRQITSGKFPVWESLNEQWANMVSKADMIAFRDRLTEIIEDDDRLHPFVEEVRRVTNNEAPERRGFASDEGDHQGVAAER